MMNQDQDSREGFGPGSEEAREVAQNVNAEEDEDKGVSPDEDDEKENDEENDENEEDEEENEEDDEEDLDKTDPE